MKMTSMVYALCGLMVVAVTSLALFQCSHGYAACPCGTGSICGWLFLPQSTAAASDGVFNTATDDDDDELTVQWCFANNPLGGSVSFVEGESSNIEDDPEPDYTPDSFLASCEGEQVIMVEGELETNNQDGTLVTRVLIGPFPGCGQEVDKVLAIDHN